MSPNDRDSSPERFSSLSPLTHQNAHGEAIMIDIGDKAPTVRIAIASSEIHMSMEAANSVRSDSLKKGDCIAVARIASIQATKLTCTLIPLCHIIPIDSVEVTHRWKSDTCLEWTVRVKSTGKTGVEMEALTGASVAALTVYDMCKAIDKSMTISAIKLLEKSGGKAGDYKRNE
jgi:cyclic pyranopterin monophosphate synthase